MADATEAAQEPQTDNQGTTKPTVEPAPGEETQAQAEPAGAHENIPPCAFTGEELIAASTQMREESEGIEKATLTLEGSGISVSGEIDPFTGGGAMQLIQKFRELLVSQKPPPTPGSVTVAARPAQASSQGTAQALAGAAHDFPSDSPSAVCTKCHHRRWQIEPGQPCKSA